MQVSLKRALNLANDETEDFSLVACLLRFVLTHEKEACQLGLVLGLVLGLELEFKLEFELGLEKLIAHQTKSHYARICNRPCH